MQHLEHFNVVNFHWRAPHGRFFRQSHKPSGIRVQNVARAAQHGYCAEPLKVAVDWAHERVVFAEGASVYSARGVSSLNGQPWVAWGYSGKLRVGSADVEPGGDEHGGMGRCDAAIPQNHGNRQCHAAAG